MNAVLMQASEPAVQPVTLEEARGQCRLVASGAPATHPDDTDLERYIAAATAAAEDFCNRAFVQRSYTLTMAKFGGPQRPLHLPIGRVLSITSIEYVDDEGADQTFTDFTFVPSNTGGVIVPAFGFTWPDVRGHTGDIVVTFVAGYPDDGGSPADLTANVPQVVRAAILLHVAHLYKHREAVSEGKLEEIPLGVKDLLWPHRIPGL